MIDLSRNMVSESKDPILQSDILQSARQYVLTFFNEKHDTRLVYHNYQHTIEVANIVNIIASTDNITKEQNEIAQLSAWFVNTGYLLNYKNAIAKSIEVANSFLDHHKYPTHKKNKVIDCLKVIAEGNKVSNTEQRLFSDAISAYEMTSGFTDAGPIYRLEWELMQEHKLTAVEWSQMQLQRLMKTKFHLPYAKSHYEPTVAQNILIQKQTIEKEKKSSKNSLDSGEPLRKFQGLERKLPSDATQTFFRANYRNHINLSAIADNKANIMISVNAIMISVLISILSYGNITESRPMILMPVVMFLVSGLTSLIFAVLSARPKVTSLNKSGMKVQDAKRNIIFFGNFVNLSVEEYEEAMDAMFRDTELIYGNMTRDLYYLGKVLDKKYRYLTISYNIFMVGFATTVITFMYALFS